jgi:uncharacterized protein YqjF (DUF2071 family)
MKPDIFLRARWRHLAVLNYEIEPAVLEPFLPPGLEIDYWHGRTYISLVAFLFERTRLCGLAIPFHCNFPEVNLRFYVQRPLDDGMRRGVVFLRELAPRRAVAFVARKYYGEKYFAVPMRACIDPDKRYKTIALRARYTWRYADKCYAIEVQSNAVPRYPEAGSLEEFIIEHYWGYSAGPGGHNRLIEYEVEHPRWIIRPAETAFFTGDAARLYGPRFAEVLCRMPNSAFLVDGSEVRVRRGTTLNCHRPATHFTETQVAQCALH